MHEKNPHQIYGTTIIAVRTSTGVAIAGDGQVSLGNTIVKHQAKKIRTLHGGKILIGFAGATADAFTLYEMFESELESYAGNLTRAAVELAKKWRSDKFLRRLEAMMLVANVDHIYLLGGNGDVVEPDDQVMAIGSGGPFALAAAKALVKHSPLSAQVIAREALEIAASICVFTNHHIETLALEKNQGERS